MRLVIILLIGIVLLSCQQEERPDTLFEKIKPEHSHIHFSNNIHNEKDFNILNYRNFYNGGGVGIGDLDNDGLPEIFFTANMGENKLYWNRGNFQFEDVTERAGVKGKGAWSTGVTFADINADGLLDIYVCNSGNRKNTDRTNELYINKGDLIFEERAQAYGLDNAGYSTHASFFDYDRDGDLDAYIVNNSFIPISKLNYRNLRSTPDSLGGDKLIRNDGGHFVDVTGKSGIYSSVIGFGLGVATGDMNNDHWPDLYISNDFYEHDYLYINNQDGTFKEKLKDAAGHTSLASMGADLADINNDAYLDLFVTDMLPRDDRHLKQMMSYEGYDLYQFKLQQGYHHQITQNVLQVNNGDETFAELARFAGIEATDWSWGALIFDMDLDGKKDLFVATGIERDLTDIDFLKFLADESKRLEQGGGGKIDYNLMVEKMPSRPVQNYGFRNEGNIRFTDQSLAWGLSEPGFSNGAAYGDLDNDGDFDLVVSNVNNVASVFRSRATDHLGTRFVKLRLVGPPANPFAVGARVRLSAGGVVQAFEVMPARGFQSSSDYAVIAAVAGNNTIDSVEVRWPDDNVQVLTNLPANQNITLTYDSKAQMQQTSASKKPAAIENVTNSKNFKFVHRESEYVDYYESPLLKQMYSTAGPALTVGDINGDNLDDLVIAGGKGQPMETHLQQSSGKFDPVQQDVFLKDRDTEISDLLLFDADNDNDLDLMAISGSSEFKPDDPLLVDRLYINDGRGRFSRQTDFPDLRGSGSCAASADFDHDGDLDLFIGGRLLPGGYGLDPPSYLLVNNGRGQFKNYTSRFLPTTQMGMVTDAIWSDVNADGWLDLVLVGDWLGVTALINDHGKKFSANTIINSEGWWNCIQAMDVDNDGDTDLVAGNLGTNSRLRASEKNPATLHVSDFDGNGGVEQVITCVSADGINYPMILKGDLEKQLPVIKKRFLKNDSYAGKTLAGILTKEELRSAVTKKVTETRTCLFLQQDNGSFVKKPLPDQAQYAPVHAMLNYDINHDGQEEILMGGNFFDVLPEVGRYDASRGWIAFNKGGTFTEVKPFSDFGLPLTGQVRHMSLLKGSDKKVYLIVGRNNDSALILRLP